MKKLILIPFVFLCGCASLSPTEKAIIVGAGQLAADVGTAAATYYGGPIAGTVAGNILNGAALDLQGYVGTSVTPAQVTAATGLAPYISTALTKHITPTTPLTQSDVNLVYNAAAVAGSTATFTDPTNRAPAQ